MHLGARHYFTSESRRCDSRDSNAIIYLREHFANCDCAARAARGDRSIEARMRAIDINDESPSRFTVGYSNSRELTRIYRIRHGSARNFTRRGETRTSLNRDEFCNFDDYSRAYGVTICRNLLTSTRGEEIFLIVIGRSYLHIYCN